MCPNSSENKLKDLKNCEIAAVTMESSSSVLRLWPNVLYTFKGACYFIVFLLGLIENEVINVSKCRLSKDY